MKPILTVRGVVFSALFAALTVVLSFAQIHLSFSPVPITLENLSVMLAGALLGGWYGFLSILLVVVLTAAGLPLLHGAGGMSLILGKSGGYVWMWPIDALLTGLLVSRVRGNGRWAFLQIFLVVELFGGLLCYVTGVAWLAHVMHLTLSQALTWGCYPYIPWDTVKALLTTAICMAVRSVYPPSRLVGSQGQGTVVQLSE